MNRLIDKLTYGDTPFCIVQKQDSEDVLLLTGIRNRYRHIKEIPRKFDPTDDKVVYDTISVVPFCQIRERGYKTIDEGEEIISISITAQTVLDVDQLLECIRPTPIVLDRDIQFDSSEKEYAEIIRNVVDEEIGNGEGANFVIPRNCTGRIRDFSVAKALAIFKSLLTNDFGTYWKFIFYDCSKFFIGSTPERHLLVQGGKVKMNPISGTFRKDRRWKRAKDFKYDLLKFLSDPKEINELFMVVDEELKMMAKMCDQGGSIIGPLLKEMSQLIHSEYILCGKSNKDIFDLFIDSMYAATVVGSPVENACNIIAKYSESSRRYYGSALMLVGRDEHGSDFLDSPITIRTAEIENNGYFHLSVGATLVKDSIPDEEVLETKAKSAAILSSIVKTDIKHHKPLLPHVHYDTDIAETLAQRNQNLSQFWFFKQNSSDISRGDYKGLNITLIHNEDDFVFMLQHMFNCMGSNTTVIRFHDYNYEFDRGDITLLGPGPGNPNSNHIEKIAINTRITHDLIENERKSLFICLGHQILCKTLGYRIKRKQRPLQGSQVEVDLFGKRELVGFYNTFAPEIPKHTKEVDVALLPELNELIGIRGNHFIGYQFHPESILTKNGYTILQKSLDYLL